MSRTAFVDAGSILLVLYFSLFGYMRVHNLRPGPKALDRHVYLFSFFYTYYPIESVDHAITGVSFHLAKKAWDVDSHAPRIGEPDQRQ
jgi:hypothetical protein